MAQRETASSRVPTPQRPLSNVNLYQNPQPESGLNSRRREGCDLLRMVHAACESLKTACEVEVALHLSRTDKLIGHQDVVYPVIPKDLSLTDLLAADANGPCGDESTGNLWALMTLCMGGEWFQQSC